MEDSHLWGITFILVLAISVLLCHLVLKGVSKSGERSKLRVVRFERRDSAVIGFLVTYALPLIGFESNSDFVVTIYVFVIVMLGLRHSGAYHFNPTMALIFRYHFYSVRTDLDMERVVITKTPLIRPPLSLTVVRLNTSVALCPSSHGS